MEFFQLIPINDDYLPLAAFHIFVFWTSFHNLQSTLMLLGKMDDLLSVALITSMC